MRHPLVLFLISAAFALSVPAEQPDTSRFENSASDARAAIKGGDTPDTNSRLTRFDLDFPGGTPQQLVEAITKASGKPLNAIIPSEYKGWKLPPLKMTNVAAPELFSALEKAGSLKWHGGQTAFVTGSFKTQEATVRLSDATVWYFYVVDFPRLQETRYFLLTPYLERGLTVDDITTAIQTGWKMRGLEDPPALSFHKETKLLIAVGDPSLLQTIDSALRALQPTSPKESPAGEKKS